MRAFSEKKKEEKKRIFVKMESSSEIVQKFLYVAEHKEQCFDFSTQLWLEKFEKCKHERINFTEAAFLIISAAKIYGHKVDYLEQMLLEFNRRSAADFKATAKDIKNRNGEDGDDAANGHTDNAKSKAAEKEKEKLQKRQKRLLKLSNKIEFNPKQFTIASPSQISLNIHEQRTDMDDEDYEQLRMKNVFPRINILQSNLKNNSSFYDNLGLVDKNCDNLDSLRDYRIFMDTIDEPMDFGVASTDATVKNRGTEKHFNAYVSAEHIKEKYGVEMTDNSDYLNMLKYGEEIERLNLRKLTIEQLGQLKVGTYLNNILHGNKQDCIIPEADSGMGESLCESTNETTLTLAEATLNLSTATNDQSMDEPNTSIECSAITQTSEHLDTTNNDDITALEVSQLSENSVDKFGEHRHSLDDGLGSSVINSPVHMADLDAYERSMLNPVVEVHDIFFPMNKYLEMPNNFRVDLNDPMNGMLHPKEAKIVAQPMDFNIFKIPQHMLCKPRLFKLTKDFDLWIAARKRKAGYPDDLAPKGKMIKLSTGAFIRADPESDDDELFGFDPNMMMRLERRIPYSPSIIPNRSFSADSGIIDKNINTIEDELNPADETENELNTSMDTDNGSIDAHEQSTLNISGDHQTGNSTEICDQTNGVTVDRLDSGFSELFNVTENGTLHATAEKLNASTTANLELSSSLNDSNGANKNQTHSGKSFNSKPIEWTDWMPSIIIIIITQ